MVQLRAKRAKKVVESSEDEDDYVPVSTPAKRKAVNKSQTVKSPSKDSSTQQQQDIKSSFLAAAAQPRRGSLGVQATNLSPSVTPDITPQKATSKSAIAKAENKRPSGKNILSFFNSATQKQQQPPSQVPADSETYFDDVISDESGDGTNSATNNRSSAASLPIRKRSREIQALDENKDAVNGVTSSHKFLKASNGRRIPSGANEDTQDDPRPWTEKYGPSNLDELAVHKKKVADVRHWLENVLEKRSQKRLLVLKGTAGAGKTVTLSLLSKALGCEILEWKNPDLTDHESEGFVSISSRFEDFVGRGRQFGGLELVRKDGKPLENGNAEANSRSSGNGKQLILMEEFPASLSRSTSASRYFRSTIQQFLASSGTEGKDELFQQNRSEETVTPFVIIISESVLSNGGNASENFTAHRILGPEILTHARVTVIEFNPVAPTFITKALNTALQKHGRATGKYAEPGSEVVQKISEIGDVRNAVSTLEFYCLQTETSSMAKAPPRKGSKAAKAKAKNNSASTSNSTQAASILSLRESTLGLFHAVGKVVYNKRTTPNSDEIEPVLDNDGLHSATQVLQSEVNVDSLIDETGTDVSTFLAAVHENYLLSCTPPSDANNTEATLNCAIDCLDALSDADLLGAGTYGGNGQTAYHYAHSASEGVRQTELSFQVGVRGVLHALPIPVKRVVPPNWPRADTFRMFYPTSLKLWRKREELSGLLDLLVARASSGRLLAGVNVSHPTGRDMTQPGRMWPPSRRSEPEVDATAMDRDEEETGPAVLHLGSGQSPRHELLFERLPYIVSIAPRASTSTGSKLDLVKQMERVTRFTGVGALQDGAEDDGEGDGEGTEQAHTGSVASSGASKFAPDKASASFPSFRGLKEAEADIGKLVLSDDDIEDD